LLNSLAFSSKEELKAIRAAIKAKGAHWTAGETWLSRLTPEERRKLFGEKTWEHKIVQPPISQPIVTSYPPPAAIDWRNKDGRSWVTPIKCQGSCGSCVSFASIATLESLICIEWNRSEKSIDLSEMHVFMCGCGECCGYGWDNKKACIYLKDNGAPGEACWPYEPVNMLCSNSCSNWQNRAVKISGYGRIEGIDACMSCVASAPILAITRCPRDYDYYTGGIYEHVWGESGDPTCDHAVCIVGYNTTGETDYWIVKNSLCGESNGFDLIKMGECQIEYLGCYSMSGSTLPSIPVAPSNLSANALSPSTIRVTWNDNSNNESGFEIWQKKENGNWQLKYKVGANVRSKNINGLQEGTKYYYRVKAYNVGGDSTFSNTASETTPPNAPSNLNPNALSSSAIRVTWNDNLNNEDGFKIQWRKVGFSWHNETVGSSVTSWTHTGLQPVTEYCYKVRAYKGSVNSNWSNTRCATTEASGGQPPAAPSNLRARAPECFEIKLTWQDNSNNEQGFNIYRQSGSNWYWFDRVGPNVTQYWDIELPCGLLWCYKVKAYNQSGNSPYSNSACAKTMACYYCGGGLSLKIIPDKKVVNSGELVTYTYEVKNKGEKDLKNIKIKDEKFGDFAIEFTLEKGKSKSFIKTATLTETTTNFAEATAIYKDKNKVKRMKAHACATVEVKK